MAIHSEHLATLEAVLATALNIVKNRTLADPTSAGTTRASSVSGFSLRAVNATSSQSKRNDSCILGSMTPSTARGALVAHYGQTRAHSPDRIATLTVASALLLVLALVARAARNHPRS